MPIVHQTYLIRGVPCDFSRLLEPGWKHISRVAAQRQIHYRPKITVRRERGDKRTASAIYVIAARPLEALYVIAVGRLYVARPLGAIFGLDHRSSMHSTWIPCIPLGFHAFRMNSMHSTGTTCIPHGFHSFQRISCISQKNHVFCMNSMHSAVPACIPKEFHASSLFTSTTH